MLFLPLVSGETIFFSGSSVYPDRTGQTNPEVTGWLTSASSLKTAVKKRNDTSDLCFKFIQCLVGSIAAAKANVAVRQDVAGKLQVSFNFELLARSRRADADVATSIDEHTNGGRGRRDVVRIPPNARTEEDFAFHRVVVVNL